MANKGQKNVIGKGFDVNPQNINKKGRPPKLINAIIKELKAEGYQAVTKGQINDCFQFMLNLPEEKIVAIGLDKSVPMMMRVISKQILSNKGHDMIERMLDRTQGKPTITTNIQSDEEKPLTLRIIDTRRK